MDSIFYTANPLTKLLQQILLKQIFFFKYYNNFTFRIRENTHTPTHMRARAHTHTLNQREGEGDNKSYSEAGHLPLSKPLSRQSKQEEVGTAGATVTNLSERCVPALQTGCRCGRL